MKWHGMGFDSSARLTVLSGRQAGRDRDRDKDRDGRFCEQRPIDSRDWTG